MNLTTFVQSIIHTNTCRHTKLYIASITKSNSKRIHVVPTFNFTIDGTVSVFIVSGNHYYNF